MATVSKFTRGAVAGNGWTNPANATADDGVYATTAPGKNVTVTGDWDFAAITSSDIPDGATINSVTAEVQWKASQGSFNTMGLGVLSGGAIVGSMVSVNPAPLSDTVQQLAYSVVPSLTDLRTAGTLGVRVSHRKGNTNNAYTGSLDYVSLTVDYTAAPAGVTGSGGVAFAHPALAGSGSETFTGTGAVSLAVPAISASGTVSAASNDITGTGAVAFAHPSLSGSGAESFSGTGAVSLAHPALAASGAQTFTGSGAVALGHPALASSALLTFTGTGGVTFAAPSIRGAQSAPTVTGPPAGTTSMMGLGR